jgi:hypothetical protein
MRVSVKVPCCFWKACGSSACRARGFPDVREDLPALFLRKRLCPGTGFYLGPFLIQPTGFLYGKIKTKRKPADASAENLLHGGTEAKFSIFIDDRFLTQL